MYAAAEGEKKKEKTLQLRHTLSSLKLDEKVLGKSFVFTESHKSDKQKETFPRCVHSVVAFTK